MTLRVAILGCGPAGLLAAHACYLADAEFVVFSKKRKSELYGSQYLHNVIPGLEVYPPEGVAVKYITLGSPEEYRRKTHGKWWDGHVAPEEFEPDHTAWDIRQAYDQLWNLYWRKVVNYEIDPDRAVAHPGHVRYLDDEVTRELQLWKYDLVISTVPRTLWRRDGDEFIYSEGWALGDAPERGVFVEEILREMGETDAGFFSSVNGHMPDNHIICDGTTEAAWTRLSKVYGYASVEWPHHAPKPHPLATRVTKPLHYTPGASQAEAPSAQWLHVGRYGQFEKGIVVTDAFNDVVNKLQEMKGIGS